MPSAKQANFVKYLLSKQGYYCEDWRWLAAYSVKEAGKLIDKLLKPEKWGQWVEDFISKLPPPTEKPRRQAFLRLPPPEQKPVTETPDELSEFKRWAREVFQKGEQTIEQLFALQDERFGKLSI